MITDKVEQRPFRHGGLQIPVRASIHGPRIEMDDAGPILRRPALDWRACLVSEAYEIGTVNDLTLILPFELIIKLKL